ncbi:amino acid adenylation domain-containing protein [Waterburya agarophytonicola K14]|uniref:Amino acid adenylation domain-containing protein n=1 Tax=Waterburya agarophytonicola KI4 TaxID=2874699 RepID=A0A964BQY8_9CYAN|nr:amino acid adenylation domain-containing protein [Waterburya agarophytonicola]MCC0176195.1 amino acid adenylation domain-containing protein [Waterburya agarophytonicola KI4]
MNDFKQNINFENKYIHQLFEEQVEKNPQAIAVTFGEQQLTYQELNQRANILARYLQSLGVKSEVLVGICVERSLATVIGLLGILKAGGAYVPVDPNYPEERISYILQDAKVEVIITQQHLLEKLPKLEAEIVCLDADFKSKNFNSENINCDRYNIQTERLAYVIYTSGSTGKPKGVLIEHRNVTRLFAATQPWYNFNDRDVWTLFHSYAFDFAVWEIWGALLTGGRLVVVPYIVSRTPKSFYDLLVKEKVTVLNQTPSAFYQLIRADEQSHSPARLDLRWVIFGGEALNLASLQSWFDRHGDQYPRLVNMYGITETTVHVTYRPINITDLNSNASVIGCSIPDLQIYLLDENCQPVPIGVEGEIYVGGAGVARGYLNRPELTAQRFIANSFDKHPQARLYKSGDLARYLENGDLEYLGRIDKQVKIRGFRIELGEVESTLVQHPQIEQCAIITKEDFSGSKILAAFLVAKQDLIPSIREIRNFLKQKLPDYMIPTTFNTLEVLPLTSNGKVDRGALANINSTVSETSATYVAPRNKLETELAKIWQQVLGIKQISIKDSFFNLGGHSLLAMSLFAQIEEKLDIKIPESTIFKASTIEELAGCIEAENYNHNYSLIPIQAKGSKDPLFCIHGGVGEIFLYREIAKYIEPDRPIYALEPLGFNDRTAPLTDIKEMAARYIEEIRKVQPEGSYLFCGYCIGGVIAWEMARQLKDRNERIDLLAMIDSYVNFKPVLPSGLSRRLNKLIHFDLKEKIDRHENLGKWFKLQIIRTIWRIYPQAWLFFPQALRDKFKQEYFHYLSVKALDKYIPEVYRDRLNVIFFRAILGKRDKSSANKNQFLSMPYVWNSLIEDNVKFIDINANHHDIVYQEIHLKKIAEKLSTALNNL